MHLLQNVCQCNIIPAGLQKFGTQHVHLFCMITVVHRSSELSCERFQCALVQDGTWGQLPQTASSLSSLRVSTAMSSCRDGTPSSN